MKKNQNTKTQKRPLTGTLQIPTSCVSPEALEKIAKKIETEKYLNIYEFRVEIYAKNLNDAFHSLEKGKFYSAHEMRHEKKSTWQKIKDVFKRDE